MAELQTLTRDVDPARHELRPDASTVVELEYRFVELDRLRDDASITVRRAYDKTLRREVILKEIATSTADEVEALATASQVASRISHPNILGLYGVSAQAGAMTFVLELVRGQTLRQWLKHEARPRPWQDVVQVLLAAGEGIAAAHRGGTAHGGLHPGNIFIDEDGRVLVSDFGIAMRYDGQNSVYLAPEQRVSGEATPRADLYAFCSILWEALCGTPPVVGVSADGSGQRTPTWPRRVRAPRNVVRALVRGLDPEPEERHGSMPELLTVLVRATARRTNRIAALGVLGAATVGVPGLWAWQVERAQLCTGAEDELRTTWSDTHRQRIEEAMLATQVSYAAETYTRVQESLTRYGQSWTEQHREACEASQLRREQPPEVLDLRMSCLRRVRLELESAIGLLARADAQVVEHGVELVAALPPVARCGDVESLMMDIPPPAVPADAQKVDAARAELAQAAVLDETGKYEEGLVHVTRARALVEGLDYEPVRVEVAAQEGLLLDHLGRYAEAEGALTDALDRALSSGMTDLAAHAASRAALLASDRQGQPLEARQVASLAVAIAEGVRGQPAVLGEAHHAMGAALMWLDRLPEAEQAFGRAIALKEQAFGPNHPHVADSHHNLGRVLIAQRRTAEAYELLNHVLMLRKNILGDGHPRVAESLELLADVLRRLARLEEAELAMREAVTIRERTLPADHPHVALAHNNLGVLLLAQGRHDEAAHEIRRALEQWQRTTPEFDAVANAHGLLAQIHLHQRRYVEAETHARRAIEARLEVVGAGHPHTLDAYKRLAHALIGQKRLPDARNEIAAALALAREALGRDHPTTARLSLILGRVLFQLQQFRSAREHLEDAWRVQSQHEVFPENRAATAMTLAELLWESKADRPRARELVARARAEYEAAGERWRGQAEAAQRWLDAQPE